MNGVARRRLAWWPVRSTSPVLVVILDSSRNNLVYLSCYKLKLANCCSADRLIRICPHSPDLPLLAQRLQLLLCLVLYRTDVVHGQAVPTIHPTENLPAIMTYFFTFAYKFIFTISNTTIQNSLMFLVGKKISAHYWAIIHNGKSPYKLVHYT